MQYFGDIQFSWRKIVASTLTVLALSWFPVSSANSTQTDSKSQVFRFPKQVDEFQRQTGENSILTGIFARADYLKKIGNNDVSVKIDIIHLLEMSPVEHFAIRRANLNNEYPNLVLKKQGDYKMKNLPPKSGYFGRFESSEKKATEAIGVWTFDLGDWDVYIKARYPVGSKAKAETEIRSLLSGINWELLRNTHPQDRVD